jgi:hypothetical protein
LFLLRFETRRLSSLLFHAPPRSALRRPHIDELCARECQAIMQGFLANLPAAYQFL